MLQRAETKHGPTWLTTAQNRFEPAQNVAKRPTTTAQNGSKLLSNVPHGSQQRLATASNSAKRREMAHNSSKRSKMAHNGLGTVLSGPRLQNKSGPTWLTTDQNSSDRLGTSQTKAHNNGAHGSQRINAGQSGPERRKKAHNNGVTRLGAKWRTTAQNGPTLLTMASTTVLSGPHLRKTAQHGPQRGRTAQTRSSRSGSKRV